MSKKRQPRPPEEREPWEQQSWETPAAFRAFHRFYLVQERPRSVNEAYRRHRAQKGDEKATKAPGTWRSWSQGKTANGKAIANALTWQERAAAYDTDQDARTLAKLEARRIQARLETADLGEMLRQKAMNALRMLVAVTQEFTDENGQRVRVVAVDLKPHEIARLAEVGVELERLALGEDTSLGRALRRTVREMTDDELSAIASRGAGGDNAGNGSQGAAEA